MKIHLTYLLIFSSLISFYSLSGEISLKNKIPVELVSILNKKILDLDPIRNDISYLMADIKFDGKNVKVCEFGEGLQSRFKGYDAMFGNAAMIKFFWTAMTRYELPQLYVDSDLATLQLTKLVDKEISLSTFLNNGGATCSDLSTSDFGRKILAKKNGKMSSYDFKGITMVRHIGASSPVVNIFRKVNPHVLVLNTVAAPFLSNKYYTNLLFDDEQIGKFKPRSMVFEKKYTSQIAKEIKDAMPAEIYVIKPLDAFKGCGIIVVQSSSLDSMLKKILTTKMNREFTVECNGYSYTDKTYSYWSQDPNKHFIVEEFCPSKNLVFENKAYDPTMRVVFIMQYINNEIKIDYFDCYWKLPLKSLNEQGSLTDKHKSIGIIPVVATEEEKKIVYSQFDEFMPILYKKMIDIINNKKLFS